MKILLLGQHFYPEDVSGAVLATQFAESLVQRGHTVTFATCFPNYPKGIVFEGYRGKWLERQFYRGATIVRTWSYTSPQKTTVRRLINYGSFSAFAVWGGIAAGRHDLIMSYSPPLPLGLTAWFLSRLWNVPWVLRVEDLFPEAAINAGVIRGQTLIHTLEAMERFVYRRAIHISVISDGFRRNLMGKGVPSDKVSVIPVWADPDEVEPLPKQNAFRTQQGLQGKFVVLYAGNMGLTCVLEDALASAELLKEQDDIHFVFIGEGVRKNEFQTLAQSKRLNNVTFLPFQPRAQFPQVLATADLALVTLNKDSSTTSLPGKTFNYLASGRPILAVAPLESETASLVSQAQCGVVVPPGNPKLLANAIMELVRDSARAVQMGTNGRAVLESCYSRQHCVTEYEKMFARFAQ